MAGQLREAAGNLPINKCRADASDAATVHNVLQICFTSLIPLMRLWYKLYSKHTVFTAALMAHLLICITDAEETVAVRMKDMLSDTN